MANVSQISNNLFDFRTVLIDLDDYKNFFKNKIYSLIRTNLKSTFSIDYGIHSMDKI